MTLKFNCKARNKVMYSDIPGRPSNTSEISRILHFKCLLKSYFNQTETPRSWQWLKVSKEDAITWILQCWLLGKMPQSNICCQDPAQTVDKQQDTGEYIRLLLPRQNKVYLTHVPPQKWLSPYGPGEDCCSDISAFNGNLDMANWVWTGPSHF